MILYTILVLQIVLLVLIGFSIFRLYPVINKILTLLSTSKIENLLDNIDSHKQKIMNLVNELDKNKDNVINVVNNSKNILNKGKIMIDNMCGSGGIEMPLKRGSLITEEVPLLGNVEFPSKDTTLKIPISCNI